jgi:hypothetical protein
MSVVGPLTPTPPGSRSAYSRTRANPSAVVFSWVLRHQHAVRGIRDWKERLEFTKRSVNGNVHDQSGRAIAWSNKKVSSVMPPMRPMTPMKHMTPVTPMRPMTPLRPTTLMTPMGGWSQSSFEEVFG